MPSASPENADNVKIDDEIGRFSSAHRAMLSTINPDGTPHLVPIVFARVGDELVSAIDWKPKSTRKLQRLENIRADPAVSLIVDNYDDDWTKLWWVRADGSARVIDADTDEGEAAIDALVAKYQQYSAERPAGPVIIVGKLTWRSWRAS
ncbi:MAG: TIGR03668 family PPOX class F420-dependent oxidoreductase [Rhodococcus sp. (in: high G+C Gram-positive bacteria)]|jgi:PPOX class probable F420-dependent enzyme|uniref:TIGR03668 family PPOX class F420-dependent oxidoreductase n=1 Tax=Rhodococcoides yunnanense TaxID=278209 RepID=UPI0022B16A34|nr:TIGR03668 family PPOX class F420-dependent oxidoreductase [Rhodococcus yunnanensis]MCZ4275905.1 TIGR03668 family PPOX class F420-dependent oxidoreductase [Rhodococcus yunnanensis]